ncbi:mesotocin receptor [Octopus bimaculoides]|uniref:G-protein coupled receptors family 1 profile domain-containing protein n=1 Tax=Octopus bimaculoides TaxID=37653 RepID=A0A0L8HIJ1_OCTBM|nr:mesotocin receptor [Octopus bimaculoides]|eukprot:XP_014772082.1 PREDICTED: mesotocin receptor-like [Octopus bimaculoides]
MEKNNNVNNCTNIMEELNAKMVNVYLPVLLYLGTVMTLGVIENFIVIYVYYYKFDESATQVFIVTLSACDFLTCIICIPMEIVILHFSFTFHSDIACRVVHFTTAVAVTNSAMIIFLISVDRFRLVCQPFNQQISPQNAKKILGFSAICSLILCTPSLFVYSKQNRMVKQCGNIGEECSLGPYLNSAVYPFAYYILIVTVFSLVFILLVLIYIKIGRKIFQIYKAKKNNRANTFLVFTMLQSMLSDNDWVEDKEPATKQRRHSMHPNRTNLILFIITLVWCICFFPYFTAVFWRLLTKRFSETTSDKEKILYKLLMCSYYLNGTLNPLVYGLFGRQFRIELISLFHETSHFFK